MKRIFKAVLSILVGGIVVGMSMGPGCGATPPEDTGPAVLSLSATDLENLGPFPEYSVNCGAYNANMSPALGWTGVPSGTVQFALVLEEELGGFVQWVIYRIPGTTTSLPVAMPEGQGVVTSPVSAYQGTNGWSEIGYDGPCANVGEVRNYTFTLYALNASLTLDAGATKDDLLVAMAGHIISTAQLRAVYATTYYP
jgi:Raf kinase inhibitor-like YbhB/YbcL family protein